MLREVSSTLKERVEECEKIFQYWRFDSDLSRAQLNQLLDQIKTIKGKLFKMKECGRNGIEGSYSFNLLQTFELIPKFFLTFLNQEIFQPIIGQKFRIFK